MSDRDKETPPHPVDAITPWLLVGLASLAALGAVLRTCFATSAGLLDRLDQTTLLYLLVAGGLLLLRQVKTLSLGEYKLELEKVRQKQAQQERQLEEMGLMLPMLLPEAERNHLLNLSLGKTGGYLGNEPLRAELRRLRSIGLIRMHAGKHVDALADGGSFDLGGQAELTDLGESWVRIIQRIEGAHAGSVARPVTSAE
jgi:hypothetical protein